MGAFIPTLAKAFFPSLSAPHLEEDPEKKKLNLYRTTTAQRLFNPELADAEQAANIRYAGSDPLAAQQLAQDVTRQGTLREDTRRDITAQAGKAFGMFSPEERQPYLAGAPMMLNDQGMADYAKNRYIQEKVGNMSLPSLAAASRSSSDIQSGNPLLEAQEKQGSLGNQIMSHLADRFYNNPINQAKAVAAKLGLTTAQDTAATPNVQRREDVSMNTLNRGEAVGEAGQPNALRVASVLGPLQTTQAEGVAKAAIGRQPQVNRMQTQQDLIDVNKLMGTDPNLARDIATNNQTKEYYKSSFENAPEVDQYGNVPQVLPVRPGEGVGTAIPHPGAAQPPVSPYGVPGAGGAGGAPAGTGGPKLGTGTAMTVDNKPPLAVQLPGKRGKGGRATVAGGVVNRAISNPRSPGPGKGKGGGGGGGGGRAPLATPTAIASPIATGNTQLDARLAALKAQAEQTQAAEAARMTSGMGAARTSAQALTVQVATRHLQALDNQIARASRVGASPDTINQLLAERNRLQIIVNGR